MRLTLSTIEQLRDRLQNEKKSQTYSQASFQDELNSIGDGMQTLGLGSTSQRRLESETGRRSLAGLFASPATDTELTSRVESLESRFNDFAEETRGRTSTMERDLESSLVVSEMRAKKLDELYREASAENEALYDRFNLELSKIVREVRMGKTEETLRSQLASAVEDIGRFQKENHRLKREVYGLRAQQGAVSLLRPNER